MKNKDRFEILIDCIEQLNNLIKFIVGVDCNLKEDFKPQHCKNCKYIPLCIQMDSIRYNIEDLRKDLKLNDPEDLYKKSEVIATEKDIDEIINAEDLKKNKKGEINE